MVIKWKLWGTSGYDFIIYIFVDLLQKGLMIMGGDGKLVMALEVVDHLCCDQPELETESVSHLVALSFRRLLSILCLVLMLLFAKITITWLCQRQRQHQRYCSRGLWFIYL